MTQVQTDASGEYGVCQKIVESIAEAEGTDPIELTPPLYHVVDPDALERLFADRRALGKVVFSYNSYEVSVFPDGYVSVESYRRPPQTPRE